LIVFDLFEDGAHKGFADEPAAIRDIVFVAESV